MYFLVCPQLCLFKLKVCVKNQCLNRSVSHLINESSSFDNIRFPATKKKNKSPKKYYPYEPTMADWIEIYHKFKYTKEVNRNNLNPPLFLISDESSNKFSCKQ